MGRLNYDVARRYAYQTTAAYFAGSAAVTAVFSGSLVELAQNVDLVEVMFIGLLVPSFTWLTQILAAWLWLGGRQRLLYVGDLSRVCFLGSMVLMPAAAVNLLLASPPLWFSMANVFVAVVVMGADLFQRAHRHGIGRAWPVSWCVTIALNMAVFVWSSREWWAPGS